jgi:hypothetical protein
MAALDQVWHISTRAGLASNSLSLRRVRSRIRSEEESSDESGSFVARCAPIPLSPCGRGWPRCEAARTGEGFVSADRDPSSGALCAPPSPTRGEGKKKSRDLRYYCVFATRGGVAVVMNCVASSIATPKGVGMIIRNGTRMRVPSTGANAISMLRWAERYLITGRSGM